MACRRYRLPPWTPLLWPRWMLNLHRTWMMWPARGRINSMTLPPTLATWSSLPQVLRVIPPRKHLYTHHHLRPPHQHPTSRHLPLLLLLLLST